MNEPDDPRRSEHDFIGCVICGQQHDQIKFTTSPRVPSQKRDPVAVSVFVIVPIALFAVVMYVMMSSYMNSIRNSKEYPALSRLQVIAEAEDSFRNGHGKYGTFEELTAAGE